MQSRRFVSNSPGLTAKYLLAKRLARGDVQDMDNFIEVNTIPTDKVVRCQQAEEDYESSSSSSGESDCPCFGSKERCSAAIGKGHPPKSVCSRNEVENDGKPHTTSSPLSPPPTPHFGLMNGTSDLNIRNCSWLQQMKKHEKKKDPTHRQRCANKHGTVKGDERVDPRGQKQAFRDLFREGGVIYREDLRRRIFAEDFIKYVGREMGPDDMSDTSDAYYPTGEEELPHALPLDEKPPKTYKDWFVNEWLGERHYRENKFYFSPRSQCSWALSGEEATHDSSMKRDETPPTVNLQFLDDERSQREDAILKAELVRINEAAFGELPNLFKGIRWPRRKKTPRDQTVPLSRLRAYGRMIDEITKCKPLHAEVDRELGLSREFTEGRLKAQSRMPPPRGARVNPNYELTEEKTKRAAAKLKASLADEDGDLKDAAASAAGKKLRDAATREVQVLGGGRYAI